MRLFTILAAMFSLANCQGAERLFKIEWTGVPRVTHYEVFRGTELLASSVAVTTEIRIGMEVTVIAVRAVNSGGPSPMSKPLTIPPVWSHHKQTIQFSADLETWSESFTPESRFARIKNELPQ